MAIMRVGFFGDSIGKQADMTVILPEIETPPPYPALYLLHGLSDDDTIWTRRTSLERYVAEMPLVVVMPDGGRGFYTDAVRGPDWEKHIMQDVIGFAERFFPLIPERSGRVIGGLSMGGYGSMKLALKYPEWFCSVVAHSSAFDLSARLKDPERAEEFSLIFGQAPAGGDNDVFALAEQVDRTVLPAIRFDCGTEDGLLVENRRFHQHLQELGIEHEYAEFPGGHEWAYWDGHIQEALSFHAAALGL
ncbi:MAG: alpha/beta hydrolase family protein [Candidatus Brocadiaceae bacterium]|jgi:S-formylglutathione hydrolase FrmB